MSVPTAFARQLLKGVPAMSRFEIFKDDDAFILVGYDENVVYTAKVTREELTNESSVAVLCYHEESIRERIVTLFRWREKVFIVNCRGSVCEINYNEKLNDTPDLFEDSPSEENCSIVKEIRNLNLHTIVASCLAAPNHLAVLSYEANEAALKITLYLLTTFEIAHSRVLLKNVLSTDEKVFMQFVDSDELDSDFVLSWFPHFDRTELKFGYILVYNCGGSVCCLQLGLDVIRSGFFFSWPSPCIFSRLYQSDFQVDSSSRKSTLLMSFEDGAIVKLQNSGGEVVHFTLPSTKTAFCVNNTLVCSDFSDCHCTLLDANPSSLALPLKGVISFSSLELNGSRILALTNYGGLYLLNPSAESSKGKSLTPDCGSLQEIVYNIDYLDELNSRILLQDASIKCLAAAVNAKNLRFLLDVQCVQILKEHHVFRITSNFLAPNDCPFTISGQDWYIVSTISLQSTTKLVHVQRLRRDFSKAQPLEAMAHFELPRGVYDCIVTVKLISFIGDGKYRPILNLGKVNLNVLSFIQPESSLILSDDVTNVHELVQEILSESKRDATIHRLRDSVLSVKIPVELPIDNIMPKLLERSQALWRAKTWDEACSNSSTTLAIAGNKLSFAVKDDSISISSTNLGLVISMKYAILGIVNPSYYQFDKELLIDVENMSKNLEIMEFSRGTLTLQEFLDLYLEKVQSINDKLLSTTSTVEYSSLVSNT